MEIPTFPKVCVQKRTQRSQTEFELCTLIPLLVPIGAALDEHLINNKLNIYSARQIYTYAWVVTWAKMATFSCKINLLQETHTRTAGNETYQTNGHYDSD